MKKQNKIIEFDKIVNEMRDIMIRKNHDYGPSNIPTLGVKGIYVRMFDKLSRLKTLVWDNEKALVLDEKTEDTLKDLANYAIMSIILLRDKWD